MALVEDTLGTGNNRAFIYTQDGETSLLEVPVNTIEWGRNLNAISRATVTVAGPDCTPALGDVEPWAHSLVVYRNGARCWEGPIRHRRDGRNSLTLQASDVLGWSERNEVTTARSVAGGLVRDQMLWAVQQTFAGGFDPNVLAYVQALGTATETADLAVAVGEKYLSEVLSDMGGNGGRYTALGRSVLLWDEAASIGQIRDLSPENHLLDDVEVIKDGDLLGTRVRARNDNGVVATGIHSGGTAIDPRYGRVVLLVPSTATTPAGVARTAQAEANRSWPIPVTIDVPADAALRCEAPFPIHDLVPGVVVPVQTTTATSVTVRGSFILTGMKVTQKAGESDQVTITLTPPSEALT